MPFPTNYSKYDLIGLPATSGFLDDVTLPLPLSFLSTGLKQWVAPSGHDIQVYDHLGNRLAIDIPFVAGSGASLTGFLNYRYKNEPISASSAIRVYAGDESIFQPDPSDTYGQYNAYDVDYEGYWIYGTTDRTQYQRHLSPIGSPTISGVVGPMVGSLASSFNGTNQYCEIAYSVTGTPRTMISWGKSNTSSANQSLISVADSGNNLNFALLEMAGAVANDPFRASARTTASPESRSSITGYLPSTWHHGVSVESSDGISRTVYKDGVSGTIDINTRNPSVNILTIGALGGSTIGRHVNGDICLSSIHSAERDFSWLNYLYQAEHHHESFYDTPVFVEDTPSSFTSTFYTADINTSTLLTNNMTHRKIESSNSNNIITNHINHYFLSNMTPGISYGQVDVVYFDEKTVTSDESVTYDFSSSRLNFFNLDVTAIYKNIKKLVVINDGPGTIQLTTDGNNIFQSVLGYPTIPLLFPSGHCLHLVNPNGWEIDEDAFTDLTISVPVLDDFAHYSFLVIGVQTDH